MKEASESFKRNFGLRMIRCCTDFRDEVCTFVFDANGIQLGNLCEGGLLHDNEAIRASDR